MTDRTPPHSLDAETAVLGSILLHGEVLSKAAMLLVPDHFYRVAHAKVYAAMLDLRDARTAVDFTTLVDRLRQRGDLHDVGGPAYLAGLTSGLPSAANVAHYAAIVREKARLRDLIATGTRLVDAAYADSEPGHELADAALRDLVRLSDDRASGGVPVMEAVGAYIAGLDTPRTALPTGFLDLDDLTGGLPGGELIIVAARPGCGKTSLTFQVAKHLAGQRCRTAVFSLEMSREAMAERIVAWEAQVDIRKLQRRTLDDGEMARLSAAWQQLDGLPLSLEHGYYTLSQVIGRCEQLQRDGGLACAVVDYLQLLAVEGRSSRIDEVGTISRGLKRLAHERGVLVLAVSQLSRAPEGRRDKRPQLSDLRESGALEQDCYMALLIHRAEMHKGAKDEDKGVAEVIVAKNRQGATGTVRLAWLAHRAQFADLARQEDEVVF